MASLTIHRDVAVPIRDGLHLLANLYKPADDRRCPVIMCVTPGKANLQGEGNTYTSAGASQQNTIAHRLRLASALKCTEENTRTLLEGYRHEQSAM